MEYAVSQAPALAQKMGQLSAGAAPIEPTAFANWRQDIGHIADRLAGLAHHIEAFGDELFGTVPTGLSEPSCQSEPHCQVAAIEAQIVRLMKNLEFAEDKFHRLRRLA